MASLCCVLFFVVYASVLAQDVDWDSLNQKISLVMGRLTLDMEGMKADLQNERMRRLETESRLGEIMLLLNTSQQSTRKEPSEETFKQEITSLRAELEIERHKRIEYENNVEEIELKLKENHEETIKIIKVFDSFRSKCMSYAREIRRGRFLGKKARIATDVEIGKLWDVLNQTNSSTASAIDDLRMTSIRSHLKNSGAIERLRNEFGNFSVRTKGASQHVTAFSVKLGSSIEAIDRYEKITFDRAIINTDRVYNTTNGTFTAPVSGVYVFFAHILSRAGEYIETDMVVNGEDCMLLYSGGGKHHGSGSNLVTVHLTEGDVVWMRRYWGASGKGYIHLLWSTFSGFLLVTDKK